MNYDYDLCKLCYYACSVCMSFRIYIRVHHFISVVSHNLSPANYCKRAYRLRRTSHHPSFIQNVPHNKLCTALFFL